MTSVAVDEAILSFFITAWGSTTPVVIDAEEYNSRSVDKFVRISIRELDAPQKTLGELNQRRFSREGLVIVQIFVNIKESPNKEAKILADSVRTIFEGKSIDSPRIWFNKCTHQTIGKAEDAFYQINVNTTYRTEVTR